MADQEKKGVQIPARQIQPLEGFPEIDRHEPITEPASQKIPKVEGTIEMDPLIEIEPEPQPAVYIPDPYRQRPHKRLGGSVSHPEGQATAEREPVPDISEEDMTFGREQARRIVGDDPARKKLDQEKVWRIRRGEE